MMGDQKTAEDRWRPLPKREKGWGLVSVCSPGGEVAGRLDKPPVGIVTRGEHLWGVDRDTYALLDLASRGHSERWLRERLAECGMDRTRFEAAVAFAQAAGLLVRYSAADGTLKGRRCFAGLTIRRRGYFNERLPDDRVRFISPDGVMNLGSVAGGWSSVWDGKALADCGIKMLEIAPTLPLSESIWWPFWEAIRSLELGTMWLDGPIEDFGTGRADKAGHWLRPAQLWPSADTFPKTARDIEWSWDGWNRMDQTVLAIATAIPLGNLHGDRGFLARNARHETIELSQDEYCLLLQSHSRRLVDISEDLALAVAPDDEGKPMRAFARGRILKAATELQAVGCIFIAKGPEAPADTVDQTASTV